MLREEASLGRVSAPGSSGAASVREAVVHAAGVVGAELERRAERGPIDDEIAEILAVDELEGAFRQAASGASGSGRDDAGLVSATVRSLEGAVELSIDPDRFERAQAAELSVAFSEALSRALGAYQRSALERARDAKPDGLLGHLCSAALAGSESDSASAGSSRACTGEPGVEEQAREPEWGAPEPGPSALGDERDGGRSAGPGTRGDALGGAVPW